MLANGKSSAAPVETNSVLVAARDIPARQQVTADDVKMRDIPVTDVLPQTYTEPEVVVGRLTSVPVYTGQQITPNLFATSVADTDFSILGPDDQVTTDSPVWRAVSLQIPSDRAVGGEIKAGQHVDVVITVDFLIYTQGEDGNFTSLDGANAQGLASGKSTKITLQDIEVLKASPDDQMYILKVNLSQAEQISHVVQKAPDAFELVLRPDEDTRQVNTDYYGVTTDRLVAQYLFPVPLLGDLNLLLPYPLPSGAPDVVPSPLPTLGESPSPEGTPGPEDSPQPEETPTPTPET
jgi:Flp pilus assembly protein CpaB